MPLMAVGLWATPAVNDLALPEQVFPQLDGILKGAVQQSPRMLSRALDLEIAENTRIQARSGLLPSMGAYYSYYQASDDRADLNGRQNVTKIAYSVSVTQPLYYWGERRNNARIGEIQAAIAKGSYRESYRLLVQELRSGYLGLIAQKVAIQRARFSLEFANGQLAQAEDRLLKRVISDAEIYPVRLYAEQAQLAAERAEFDFQNAKLSFARLAGIGSIADDAIPKDIPSAAYPAGAFDSLLAGYLSQKAPPTTEAFTLRQMLEMEKLNYASAKTRLRPKFNAVLGTTQDEQSYTQNVAQKYQVNSIYGGVSASWSIFDGFAAGAAVRTSLARRRQLENDYRQLTERLAQEAQTQVKQINFSARSMSFYDRLLISGEGNLKTRQEEFRRGVRSEADVSQAQISLFDRQIDALKARSDYLMKIGEFLGTITEDPILNNLAQK